MAVILKQSDLTDEEEKKSLEATRQHGFNTGKFSQCANCFATLGKAVRLCPLCGETIK